MNSWPKEMNKENFTSMKRKNAFTPFAMGVLCSLLGILSVATAIIHMRSSDEIVVTGIALVSGILLLLFGIIEGTLSIGKR
jgi:hypothetical protein